ncbi:LLM class flavin-dependent oxidoreductase [Luteimicrobium sp. NPDC057192]|uniref:LLM class flavin-dependent oxidoreductase n=1 Tax=Luteimicrobium sp. NPDC057192 TaxID=3346042 RepID=UPI0036293288
MSDYGHDLAFGSFLTPQAGAPDDVVNLAVLSEEVGLDLVTFQDHPYNAGFLDTWTLLSFVAARTERVHLSPNVANLPLRPPAVLARAAASLDLLSHGRAELGLGSGAFWDGIAAMGGERLTPAEGVDALEEAIDVIRGIWDADDRTVLRAGGEHHHVAGARRGPRPAHAIGLWLGAYKPRMLRLTGARADGWLPSLGYLQPGDLARGNEILDGAAEAAGRDPREVRRILNIGGRFRPDGAGSGSTHGGGSIDGPARHWVDELVRYVLEDGVGTFVLGSDNPRDLTTFAQDVAPAVREAVAAERASSGTDTGPVRSPRALTLRAPGIDYDAIPARLRDHAVEPGDRDYARTRSSYIRGGRPGLVLRAKDAQDVVEGLGFAREQQARGAWDGVGRLPLSVRSAGHGISGHSTNDGGIVLDLRALDQVTVLDPATRRVRVGAGASWGHVAAALADHGWGMSSGDSGDVGVGGLATAGGVGLMGRLHGLTIDHAVAYDVVLADGSLVHATADEHPDLFWGLRGAGGGLGIVTAVELEAYEVPPVVLAIMLYDASDARGLLEAWGSAVEDAPRELTSFLTMQPGRGETPALAQAMTVVASDDVALAERALEPLLRVAPLLQQQAQLAPYAAVVAPHDAEHLADGPGGVFRNTLVDRLDDRTAAAAATAFESGRFGMFQVRAVGGAVNDVASDATAYAHRDGQQFDVSGVGFGSRERADAVWDDALDPVAHGEYVSLSTDRRPERVERVYPGATLARLRDLKRRYDPENVFDRNIPLL